MKPTNNMEVSSGIPKVLCIFARIKRAKLEISGLHINEYQHVFNTFLTSQKCLQLHQKSLLNGHQMWYRGLRTSVGPEEKVCGG